MKYNAIDELGEIRRRRGIAYYHQLYALLLTALGNGLIAPGSALPSETQLMERFQVSRNTVRRAFARLEQEKRIIRRRGSGTYARSIPKARISATAVAETLQENDAPGPRMSNRLLRVHAATTPEFIRRRDPAFGERCLLVQRCRSFESVPFLFSTSYVPEPFASRLSRKQLARQAVLSALAAAGIVPKTAEQTTTALAADAFTARHLGVEVASAVLCIHRLIRDAESRSIEHQSLVFHPERCQLHELIAIEHSNKGLRCSDTQSRQPPAWL